MSSWRRSWAAAQITPALFSTLVWIVWLAASPQGFAAIWAAAAVVATAGTTRLGLWWRFGARTATAFERDTMLRVIVPLACLRGREQPSVWIATRLTRPDVVMPGTKILVVRSELLGAVVAGRLSEDEVCALFAHALGQQRVYSSVMVAVGELYCWPGALVAMLAEVFSRRAGQGSLLSFGWRIRWLLLGVATVDNSLSERWPALIGVVILGTLSWSTGRFARRWSSTLLDLGDERVLAEGFGPTLAGMVRSHNTPGGDLERVSHLLEPRSDSGDVNVRRGSPSRAPGKEAALTSAAQA